MPDDSGMNGGATPDPGRAFAFGCLFCRTGREENVRSMLRGKYPQLMTLAPEKIRYRRMGGKAYEERVRLFPGYLFFMTRGDEDPVGFKRIPDVLRLLTYQDGDWRLHGSDARIARSVFENEGLIGPSKAYFEGDRIRIVSGFLKAYEGNITRVNRRARSAEIRVQLYDKVITVWLSFELIEKDA